MRILIPLVSTSSGTWGGLTRALAVAKAARAAGHEVLFCAAIPQKTVVEQHGFPVYELPSTTMFGLPPGLAGRLERQSARAEPPAFAAGLTGNFWAILTLIGYARASYLRQLVDTEMQIVERCKPDLLFTDIDLGAILVTYITGLLMAAAYQGVTDSGSGSLPWRLIRRACADVLRRHDREPVPPEDLWFRPEVLKIIPSIPELDGTPEGRSDVRYVGSLLETVQARSDFALEAGRRCVFAYAGSGSISLDRLERVLPQVFPAGSDVTCLVGAQSITQPKVIGNVHFRSFIPAEAVLPQCDWTICHGGQNTITQSLLHGVPLLVFPGSVFERRFNGRKVVENGAGLLGERDQFTAEWLKAAFARRAEFAPTAARLGDRIRAYGGAAAAVAALEAWAAHRAQPITSG